MIRTRIAVLAVVAATFLSALGVGSVSAAEKSTFVTNVWGTMGVWGTYTHFFARWQITSTPGGSLWSLDDFDMDANVTNGKTCNGEICTAWSYSANAKFITGAAAQVGPTLIPTQPGNCYASAIGINDRLFSRCKSTPFTVSTLATKVKLTWTVSVQRQDGLWVNAWSATKTVPIS